MSLNLELDVLDAIFYESYVDESDASEEDESDDLDEEVELLAEAIGMEEFDVNEGSKEVKLGISEDQARANYENAGTEVLEKKDTITVEKHADLIKPDIDELLDEVLEELKLPYGVSDFQRVAVNTVCSLKHLILVSPTGSGKMNVPLLSALVLRKRLNEKRGVTIVTQPLTSIMNQKMDNAICKVAVLSMTGSLKAKCSDDDDDTANLSCEVADVLDGEYPVILGHPESFDSPLGQYILRELQRRERLICVCIDEFHQGGEGHWSTFRPDMMRLSAGLRLYGIQNCPTVCMTATATDDEIKEVIRALGLRTDPEVLTASPVQAHIKFSVIRRPSNNFGLEGTVDKKGVKHPGLMDLLDRVYLRQYLTDLEEGKEPKRAIIFCRGNGVLGAIYSHLMARTNGKYKDCRDSPFVMNHSCLLPPTEKVLAERASEISLYLSSNKMLLGIDLARIDMVVFLRPYNQLAALLQGGGRGGRRTENGRRRRVQVYQFYNSQDFTVQNKLMSPDMKRICKSEECTKDLLREYFAGDNAPDDDIDEELRYCCHNCDMKISETS